MGQTLSLVNWQHHASIVRRDAMLREIIGATNQINQLAYNAPTDTKEVVERAESMLLSVTDREVKNAYKPLNDFLIEAFNEAKEVCDVYKRQIDTGLSIMIVINKIDRPGADPEKAYNDCLDLMADLGATDEQLEFAMEHVVYALSLIHI